MYSRQMQRDSLWSLTVALICAALVPATMTGEVLGLVGAMKRVAESVA